MSYPEFNVFTDHLKLFGNLPSRLKRFRAFATAEKRFLFTRGLMACSDMLAEADDVQEDSEHKLSDARVSSNWRAEANKMFRAREYSSAVSGYTVSLMKAEPGTESEAYALANRSAALYHLRDYRSCLNDIRRALGSDYPAALAYKLYERAGNACRKLGRGESAKENYSECLVCIDRSAMSEEDKRTWKTRVADAIKSCEGDSVPEPPPPPVDNGAGGHGCSGIAGDQLLGGPNEQIPALSKHLELKYSEDMGRGVYATRDINPGDVVAIDEPYVGSQSALFSFVCYNTKCLKKIYNGIMCPKCSLVYFCSEECIQKAYLDGHKFECPITYSITKIPGIPLMNHLVLKWFMIECTKMGIENYCSLIKSYKKMKTDPNTKGFDKNHQYKSDSFFTAFSLENRDSKFPISVLFFFNCISATIINYLILSGFEIPEHCIATVGASLVHMLIIIDLNCRKFNVSHHLPQFIKMDNELGLSAAYFLYPSICLFNHSCDPNVKRSGLLADKRRVMKAVQPIPKGSQLFISYGVVYKLNDKTLRNLYCEKYFKFKCVCTPCLENWPISRFTPNRVSSLNLLNPSMADTVTSECNKFLEFKNTTSPENFHQHLNYLYSFCKLIYENVKRPFKLYEDCVAMISRAHSVLSIEDTDTFFF